MAATARVLTGLALVIVVGVDALYIGLIVGQGGGDPATPLVVPFISAYLVLVALSLLASLIAPASSTPALRGGAAGGLSVLGVFAAFSIGLPLLLAALFAIVAAVLATTLRPGARSVISAVLAGVVAVGLLLVGFQISWSYLVCPASGQGGGTEPSLIGPGPSYECNGGVLTVHK